jgi:hypothetical protein
VRDHQDVARSRIGRHAGDQSLGIEAGRELEILLNLSCG